MGLERKLLVMKADLLIERKKIEKSLGNFRKEVAVSNVIHAISEALEVLKEGKEV